MRNEYNKVIFLASISQPAVIRMLRSNTECAQFVLTITGTKKPGMINVISYDPDLINQIRNYIIPENIGKRIMVSGSYIFTEDPAPNSALVNATSIVAVENLISQAEADVERENRIDFSRD